MGQAALDLALQRAWPPLTTAPIGPWTARVDAGVTRRANSVLTHGDGADPDDEALDALLAETVSLYAGHGLTPWLQVTSAAWPPRLEDRLEARGWQTRIDRTLLLGGPPRADWSVDGAVIEPQPSPEWIDTWWTSDPRGGAAELEVASALLTRIESAAFARAVDEDAATMGVGLGVLVGETLVLECLATVPGSRRRGVATRVIAALSAWAAPPGARQMLLAVQERNQGALALYRSLGLEPIGAYSYARPAGE